MSQDRPQPVTACSATRRTFLASIATLCAPVGLLSCGSQQDIVGRVSAGAEPEAGAPAASEADDSATSAPNDAGPPPLWSGHDDAGRDQDVEVIVWARPAPADAPQPERWPLPRPLAPFEPQPPGSGFDDPPEGPEQSFTPDAGFGGDLVGTDGFGGAGGGHDGAGEPDEADDMWDESEPGLGASSQDEPWPEQRKDLSLRFFGRDAQRLIDWSPVRLSFMRDSEPLLIEDSSGLRYFVVLRLGL